MTITTCSTCRVRFYSHEMHFCSGRKPAFCRCGGIALPNLTLCGPCRYEQLEHGSQVKAA